MEAILVINPGSTSTKVAIYADDQLVAEDTIRHSVAELEKYPGVMDQIDFRYKIILEFVKAHQMLENLVAVVGRGGLLKPIPGGTYKVDEAMLEDLRQEKYNTHASNLGAILANEFTKTLGIPAFIVDPVVVDELQPLARISGLKGIERRSVAHALNQKAVARKLVKKIGKTYEASSLIVAHLGGGISIGAHQNGKMIEVVNGLDGEGPYTPERSGELPLVNFAEFILSKQMSLAEVKKLIAGEAGLKSYLGETDLREIQKRIDAGDEEAKFYLDGMSYQVGKSITELAAVFRGKVDAIILTGGIIHSDYVSRTIGEYVDWLAPVLKFPGEMEMQALYEGARRVLDGEEMALDYSKM
ncbi:butyrate kinase [Enterococcus sp. LJL90]